MTTRLLITGSRESSLSMNIAAAQAVDRAQQHGWSIIVGDAAGIDRAVIRACCKHHVAFQCFGITNNPRCIVASDELTCNWRLVGTYIKVNGNFFSRDRHMVVVADRVLAIWNGSSNGTRYTFEYAQKLGKKTDVMNFSTPKVQP